MLGRALPGVPGNLCRGWPSTQPFLRGRWSPRLETLEPPRAEGRAVGFPSIHQGCPDLLRAARLLPLPASGFVSLNKEPLKTLISHLNGKTGVTLNAKAAVRSLPALGCGCWTPAPSPVPGPAGSSNTSPRRPAPARTEGAFLFAKASGD